MPDVKGKKKRAAGRVSVTVHLALEDYQKVQAALTLTDETQSGFIAAAATKRAEREIAKAA